MRLLFQLIFFYLLTLLLREVVRGVTRGRKRPRPSQVQGRATKKNLDLGEVEDAEFEEIED